MTTRNGILRTAARYIGATESPPGSNRVVFWRNLGLGNGYGPWCAAFVVDVYRQNGSTLLRDDVPLPYYTPSQEAWAKRTGRWRASKDCKPGDPLIFGFGKAHAVHVEILERQIDANRVQTIGGNTSPGNSGSQANGGGVFRRIRYRRDIRGGIDMSSVFTAADPPKAKPRLRLPIVEDGDLGEQTRMAWEKYLGAQVDGVWDRMDVRRLQSWASRERTGSLSRDDVRAFESKLGLPRTGIWSEKLTVAMQKFANRRLAGGA